MPIDPNIITAAAGGTTYFTTLVKVTALASQGGDIMRFCLHTRPITFDSELYEAMYFEPSKMQMSSSLQTDNASITHMLDAEFEKRNIRAGKWQGATVEMMLIDYRHPEWGYIRRHIGRVGEIRTFGKQADTEFRSLTSLLLQEIGDKTSKSCRYMLGDGNCGVNVANFTFPATVTSVVNRQVFTVSIGSFPAGVTAGLLGSYYGGTNFEQYAGSRRDPDVNFNFGATPFPGLSAQSFSVRWEGRITPVNTENKTFVVDHDDGVKVWVDGNLIIDQWSTLGTHSSSPVALTGGTPYTIKIEYRQFTGPAYCNLKWNGATETGGSNVVIPGARFSTPSNTSAEVYTTDYFRFGKAVWLTGLNAGRSMETINSTNLLDITLFLPMPENIVMGDTLNLIAGDDKSLATCHNKFNNAINHGGEDCIPNLAEVFKIPESNAGN